MKKWIPFLVVLLLALSSAKWLRAAQDSALPDAAYVNGVVGHPQQYNLSCESRSAADWAAYFGVTLDEASFLWNLPRSDNPDVGFVGSANDVWGYTPPYSYGVHAAPVAQLLRNYGLQATAYRGATWDNLRAEIVNGRPVIVWVIGSVWPGVAQPYTAVDGQQTTVAAYEHTMILVGYDPTSVYLVDASSGLVTAHGVADFLSSWAVLGNMAVMAGDGRFTSAATTATYTVQPGDSLLAIAARFNLSWHELAALNNLATPDVIFVGQILRLPGAVAEESVPVVPAPTTSTTAATYTVQPGQYLLQIADDLGMAWQTIAELNNLVPPQYIVYPGQVLQLPGGVAAAPAPVEAAPQTIYTVQSGDTLFKIATRFGLDWPTLAQYNGIVYPYQIYAGQSLQIP
ncbi:MAG: LysM peptidoglycan-binding domain-containing protein [Anaerolineales bacterium]|nr:LysM peptidoglycan-binding domain-containing protein [Anaerolineales bacterium]